MTRGGLQEQGTRSVPVTLQLSHAFSAPLKAGDSALMGPKATGNQPSSPQEVPPPPQLNIFYKLQSAVFKHGI